MAIRLLQVHPVCELSDNTLQASVLERVHKSGFLHQPSKEVRSGQPAQLQIALPGSFVIVVHPDLILKRIRLGDAVVNVIQREAVDMMLLLPEE